MAFNIKNQSKAMRKIVFVPNKIVYPLLASVCFFLQNFIFISTMDLAPFLPFLFCLTFPLLFTIIPEYIIRHKLMSDSKSSFTVFVNKENAFQRIMPTKTNTIVIVLLLFLAISRFISDLFLRFFVNLQIQGFTMPVVYSSLLVTWGLSSLITKTKLGRHRIVAICFVGCLAISQSIYYSNRFDYLIVSNFKTVSFFIIFLLIETLFLSLKEVLERYLMINHFISPYLLLFFEGITSSFFFVVLCLVVNTVNCDIFGTFEKLCRVNQWIIFKEDMARLFSTMSALWGWGFIIAGLLLNCFRITMNKELTPTHRYISENMANFYFLIYQLSKTLSKDGNFIPINEIIGLMIIQLFAIAADLLFNEHIIVYCFGLQLDTKDDIAKRSVNDQIVCQNISLSLID